MEAKASFRPRKKFDPGLVGKPRLIRPNTTHPALLSLHQIPSIDHFTYRSVERYLQCNESDENPESIEGNVTGETLACDRYAEVQCSIYI